MDNSEKDLLDEGTSKQMEEGTENLETYEQIGVDITTDDFEISEGESEQIIQPPVKTVKAPMMGIPAAPSAAKFAALQKVAETLTGEPKGRDLAISEAAEIAEEAPISAETTVETISPGEPTASSTEEPATPLAAVAEEPPKEAPPAETPPSEKKYKHITFRKPGEQTEGQKRIAEFVKQIDAKIVKCRHFKTGKLDDYGHIVGIHEYPEGRVPHVHQDHFYDELGRVIKLQKYDQDFSKPTTRLYFYEGDSDKLSEAVWLDRYGKIDNIHRYCYDEETGLLKERAEYDREGALFYSIRTKYDMSTTPPRQIEEAWYDKGNKLIKRFVYKYDENGEICTEERYDSRNQFAGAFHFQYDERGILKEKKWQNSNGVFMSAFRYEVDADENVTRAEMYDGKMNLESVQIFNYDAIGNLISETWQDASGKVIREVKY